MSLLLLFGYILGIHQGRIALWEEGKALPEKVFPYSAALLPEADRQRLKEGIYVKDKDELAQIAEDYLS